MDVVKVIEMERYSYDELSVFLSESSINKLMIANIIKRVDRKTQYDLGFLSDEDFYDTNMDIGIFYVFRFVGIICIDNIYIIAYPKYFEGGKRRIAYAFDEDFSIIRELIAVIDKYESLRQNHQEFLMGSSLEEFNLLMYTLNLLEDFHRYGLYCNDISTMQVNGNGDILWDPTIARMPVYFSGGNPVYLNFYTDSKNIDYSDFVRGLHACILTSCCERLYPVLEVLGIQSVQLSSKRIEDFGEVDYVKRQLQQEFTRQFETRKQMLINQLLCYIDHVGHRGDYDTISFVGTVSMEMVWEDVCAKVKGDCRKVKLSDLNCKYEGLAPYNILQDVIPTPVWTYNDGSAFHTKKTLIPDLIVIQDGYLEIYDAKYYKIKFNESGIEGMPGVADITKQFLYQKAYNTFARLNGLKICKNAFLFPGECEEELQIGTVSLDLFHDDNLLPIDIILAPTHIMYQKYLQV